MKWLVGGLWVLVFACLAGAQTLTLPASIAVPVNKEFVVGGKTDCVSVVWYFPDGELTAAFSLDDLYDVPPTWKKKPAAIQLNSGSVEKSYRVVAVGANAKGAQTKPQICVVIVGAPAPVPPGPTPVPPVPPVPPTPDSPIDGDGFKVLFVFESGDLGKMSRDQWTAITSADLRAYLQKKCIVEADGKTPARRFFDKDTDTTNDYPYWQKAMKRQRGPLPWLVISNGKTGFDGPMPANLAETMTLLKKFGGE